MSAMTLPCPFKGPACPCQVPPEVVKTPMEDGDALYQVRSHPCDAHGPVCESPENPPWWLGAGLLLALILILALLTLINW